MKKIKKIIISFNCSIFEAIKLINRNTFGICFVVDNKKKLIGSISDGDIRRKIIKKYDFSKPVSKIMNKKVKSFHYLKNPEKIFKSLNENIKIIPLLNDHHEVVDFVSLNRPDQISLIKTNLGGNELKYLTNCIKSGWISSLGKYLDKFENIFSKFTKLKNVMAVSSGTAALQLAIESLGISKGDEVIVPNLTFAAPINTIIHSGAKPVLVDIKKETLCIDERKIESAITINTKAIIVVHLYGHPANMHKIKKICLKNKILLIEDCAEALGSKYNGKHVGRFGDASTFSFFGNKTLTTGEGGIISFKRKKHKEKALLLRDHGMSKKEKYWHIKIGYNFRMTNLQAAVGTAQFERAQKLIKEKITIANLYKKHLEKVKGIRLIKNNGNVINTYWLYVIVFEGKLINYRDKILNYLSINGVDSRKVFFPISEMPIYKNYCKFEKDLEISNYISRSALCLPSSGIHEKEIKRVCEIIKKYVSGKK